MVWAAEKFAMKKSIATTTQPRAALIFMVTFPPVKLAKQSHDSGA
jgi:hypothetical protein